MQEQRKMEENPNKLEIYELRYLDLFLLSTHCHSSSSLQDNERIESITKSIFEALGPSGPGLLAITGVPNSSVLRRTLLPLARKLALLNPDDRKRILKVSLLHFSSFLCSLSLARFRFCKHLVNVYGK